MIAFRHVRPWGAIGVLLLVAACQSAAADASSASAPREWGPPAPAVAIDSFLPMQELIARFQEASGARPDSLRGGSGTPGALVRRYVAALARADTATLRRLAVSRSEYAHLVFPHSVLSRAPYELNPEVAWLMLTLESEKGVTRALHIVPRLRAEYAGFECAPAIADSDPASRIDCVVSLRLPDSTVVKRRLFGEIVEVRGRYKFLGYANSPAPP